MRRPTLPLLCLVVSCTVGWSLPETDEEQTDPEIVVSETVEVVGEKVDQSTGKIERERILELHPIDIGDLMKKDVAGLGTIRKSGIGLDPILRGLGRENLPVLADDAPLHGACPNRMDPPAFHIAANQVEEVSLGKGPFDVTSGPGQIAGVVRVRTRQPEMYENFQAHPEVRGGLDSNPDGRKAAFDMTAGQRPVGFRISYDYKNYDGYTNRNLVASGFEQHNVGAHTDWLTGAWGRLEFHYAGQRSKNIFYPTLAMDSPWDNLDLFSAAAEFLQLPSFLKSLQTRVYASHVDHLMDNLSKFEYATPPPAMKMEALAESRTTGGKIQAELAALDGILIGLDYQDLRWDVTQTVLTTPRTPGLHAIPDATVSDFGLFLQPLKKFGRLTMQAGLRTDSVRANARDIGPREAAYYVSYYGPDVLLNPNDSDTNFSGFVKATYSPEVDRDIYVGIGRAVRSPDPRERYRILGAIPGGRYEMGNPALAPEASLQIEAGAGARAGGFHYSGAVYYNTVNDFVARTATGKTYMMRPVLKNENIDARLYGLELSVGLAASRNFSVYGQTSYTRGENRTYDKPLGEILPWEGKIGLRFDETKGRYWAEAVGRFVAGQDRYDPVTDAGATPGFSTFDLMFGWRLQAQILLTAGLQNLLNRYYWEHTSQYFAFNQDGFTTRDRIPEPGRSFYLNLTAGF